MATTIHQAGQLSPDVAPKPTTQITIGCLFIPLLVAGVGGFFFFNMRLQATSTVQVPERAVLLVYAAPDETAPLLARFGAGRSLKIIGRSADWRWLKVALWDGQFGWAQRPLDILVWQLEVEVADPVEATIVAWPVTPIAPKMIELPAATFTMGSPPGQGENDERPAHPVSLSAFALDQTEVTVSQYWQCVIAGFCAAPDTDASQDEPHYYNDPAFNNHPAINISWQEANNYCSWRGKRLPTEAEWEMAASWHIDKSAKFTWPWGNELHQITANSGAASLGKPAQVGQFTQDQSPAGILDLGGNVSEWVFDWYKVDYYSVADGSDPIGPSHRRGEGSGRVVRGGSFADTLDMARATNRRHQAGTYGYPTIGFRCAQEIRSNR